MPDPIRPLPATAVAALSNGNKIEAIKIVREEWGLGLKEAKDAVEAYIKTQPALAATMQEAIKTSQRGCITWLLVLALAGIAGYYIWANMVNH